MRIKEIEIYGYGKWIDCSFTFSEHFQVFFGDNESGKSTLMSFVHSVFFGFPTRTSKRLRYEPKQSSRYGGKLHILSNTHGSAIIERTQTKDGKVTGDVIVKLENGETGSDELLNELLLGMDYTLFRQLFSIRLSDLEEIRSLSKENFQRFFLSAGSLGSEKFLKQANQFSKQASELYKPTGRNPKINQLLTVIESKEKKLNQAKEKNEDYLKIGQKIEHLEMDIQKMDKKRNSLSLESAELDHLKRNWHLIESKEILEKELEQFNLPNLPQNGLFQLDYLNQEIDEIRSQIQENYDNLQEFKTEYLPSKELLIYQENQSAVDDLDRELPQMIEIENKKKYLIKDLNAIQDKHIEQKISIGVPVKERLPQISKNDWDKASHLNQKDKEITDELQKVEEEISKLTYALKSYEETINFLEEKMSIQKKSEETSSKQKNSYLQIGTLFTGLLFILLGVFIFQENQLVLSLLGILIIAISVFLYWRKNKVDSETIELSEENPSDYKNHWRQQLAEMDVQEAKKQEQLTRKEDLLHQKQVIQLDWNQFIESNHLPQTLLMEELALFKGTFEKIIVRVSEINKKEENIKRLERIVLDQLERVSFLNEIYPLNENTGDFLATFQHFLRIVKSEMKQKEDYLNKSEEVHRSVQRLTEKEKKKEREKQELFELVGVQRDKEFRQLYQLADEKTKKEENLRIIEAQQDDLQGNERFSTLEDVQKELTAKTLETKQVEGKINELTSDKVTYDYEMKKLAEGGEYTELLQDFENIKNELQDLVDEWASLEIASSLMEETLHLSLKEQFPLILSEAESFFKHLTGGKYVRIKMEDDDIYVLDKQHGVYNVNELSRGTAEPLYVALRLAFIKLNHETLDLPIIIDDAFVNMDRHRKRRVYELLERISKDIQVIYFTFDQTMVEFLKNNQSFANLSMLQ